MTLPDHAPTFRPFFFTLTLALIATPRARADDPPANASAPAPAPVPPVAPLSAAGPAVLPNVVTLDEAVRRAVARNPSVEIANDEIRRAEALVEQARSASLPTLGAGLVYTRLDADRELNGRVIAAANQLSGNVTLAVPIAVPQRWAQWSHASDFVVTTRAQALDVRRQIAAATAHAYLAVVAQHRVIDALERARQTARAHLDFATQRFTGGIGTRLDQVRAAEEVASAESQTQSAYGGLARAREALGVLMGESEPVDAGEEGTLADVPDAQSALADAAQRRADVRAQEQRVAAASRAVRDRWADYVPYLLGVAQAFYQNPPTLTQPEFGWQAQLILTFPIYDGGLRYGQDHERRALLAEARASLDAAVRQARSEVRAAFEIMRAADASLVAARESVSLADESLALAVEAYRAGATTNLEVIDAQRRARDAATNVAVAEDLARQARLDLLLATGHFP